MKMIKLKLAVLLFFLSMSISAQSVGANFTLAFPQGDFKQNVDKIGFGLNLEGVYFFNPAVGIGLDGSFYNYGSESRSAAWSTTIPDVTLQVSRTNNIGNLHLFFRIAPPFTLVKPYVDLIFGGSYLWTDTKVYSQKGINSNEEIATTENLGDFAWSYGFGGGLMFKVASIPFEEATRVGSLFIDLKVKYLFGSQAEYLREGDVQITSTGHVVLHPQKSKTDILTAHLGVVFYF